MKTIVFIFIGIVIVGLAYGYTLLRKQEFKSKSQQCQQDCRANGFDGWDYKLSGFKKGQCECINFQ